MKSRPVVIVLAAGRGSRFRGDSHKLEQPLNGISMLAHTLRQVIASHLPVVVVTTAALEAQARGAVAARDVVVLPDAGSAEGLGIGTSIAAGVAARPHAPGWLVLPADMPLVQPSTFNAVADALTQTTVVAYAQYAGRRGHPVGFAAGLFTELITLRGDEGARRLVSRFPAQAVDVDDPGVLVDVDTTEDLAALRAVPFTAAGAGVQAPPGALFPGP